MSDKNIISTAVIGVGHLGQWHARKLAAMDGASLAAVVDADIERAKSLAAELGCQALSSVRDLPDIVKAAVVSVPTAYHFEVADYLLDHGIDILVEKPIAADIVEGRKIVDKARRLNRVMAVGHVERMNPAYRAAKNNYGKPYLIEARRLAPLKSRAVGVDVVRDIMIHDIDLCLDIAGGEVILASVAGASILTDKVDVARAHLRFDNGVNAYIIASRVHSSEARELEIFDDEGCLHIDLREKTLGRYAGAADAREYRPLSVEKSDALEAELRDFLGAVRTHSSPTVDGEAGLKALALAIEIIDGIEKGNRG